MESEIVIVSGLPRSGTSLMMQMLDQGGVPIVTDNIRSADGDNPRGYYELERVKGIKHDSSWLPEIRGRAFKMVSQLLRDLPAGEHYRIIFMKRDLDEVVSSQEKMLARLERTAVPTEEIKRSYRLHLNRLAAWLSRQANMKVLYVQYRDLIEQPQPEAERVAAFLGGRLHTEKMARAIDSQLYRNRNSPLSAARSPRHDVIEGRGSSAPR
jgi:sulfotransferase family protein